MTLIDAAHSMSSARPDARESAERDLRHAKLRTRMEERGLELLIAYAPGWRRENVRYLTNAPMNGSAGLALLGTSGGAAVLTTRAADVAEIVTRGWVTDVDVMRLPSADALRNRVADLSVSRIGVAHLELLPAALLAALRDAAPRAEIESATDLMDDARLVKSHWELDVMRRSARVCAAGWQRFVDVLEPGLPEYKITGEVEAAIKAEGAENNFMLIASGGDEVLGMTPPGSRRLIEGDMVRTELTPQMNGYWLQICRSAIVGVPSDAQRRSFDLFNEAVEAGMAVVRPGVTAHEVAVAENDVFRRHDLGEYCGAQWTRVRGHGHGLHLDETPIIEGNHTVLPEGAVFIIHPNTYTPLAGYHVLGDPVVVTKDGYEVLISTERKLFSTAEDKSA
jgi:Xaa-Pro aminopeptidase